VALSRLCEYFKDDLLTPVGRKMVRTPLAEELAQPLRELLQQAENVIRRKPTFSPESSERRFRTVMSDFIAIMLMTRALPEIQRQAPGIKPHILPLQTGALEHDDTELVILPKQLLAKGQPSELMFDDEFVCIACATNKLIRRSLSARDCARLSHVVMRLGEQHEAPNLEEAFMGRLEKLKTAKASDPNPFVIGNGRCLKMWNIVSECIQTEIARREGSN